MHSEERKKPYNTLNRTNNTVQELSEKKWPQKRKGKKRNALTQRSPIKAVKSTHTKSLRTDSLVKEDLSKVPKRSAHNRKQSY